MDLDLAVDIEVPTAQVLRRLAARRVCVDCGANYSVSAPPKVNWTCDVCGGEVIQREDDTEEAIRVASSSMSARQRRSSTGTRTRISWPREVTGDGPRQTP